MESINFVVLGDPAIAASLGKKGTSTDITIYDRKTAETVYTWTVPNTFPDKIQPLVQAVNIAEYAILNAAKMDKFLGEQILALDYAGIKDGFVLHSYEVDREKLKTLLKNTSLANYQFLDSVDDLKQAMTGLKPKGGEGPLMIPVDHAFDVKGVGTVVLGVVRKGAVKVYDELTLLPSGKNILVKSIQMHDDPAENAASPARVGLAVKGASADDISRGDVLCAPGAALGYTVKTTDLIVRMKDHGVSLNFIKELTALGYTNLNPDELVRTKDHGVSARYISEFRTAGYERASLDDWVTLRDHGVSTEFVSELKNLGYDRLPLEDLRRMKDHGVSASFIKEIRDLGYANTTIEQLVRLKDHGVSAAYIKRMKERGYGDLTLDEYIRLRDRGERE